MAEQLPIVAFLSDSVAHASPAPVMKARMPDVTNISRRGHGMIGRVDVSIDSSALTIVGPYATGYMVPLVVGMLGGCIAGLLLGAWLAGPPAPSWRGEALRIAAILGGLALGWAIGLEAVKAYVVRHTTPARMTFPLASIRLLRDDAEWEPRPSGGPAGELADVLSGWAFRHIRSSREVLLTAPTPNGARELMRIIMDDPDEARQIIQQVRSEEAVSGTGC